jgi:predicted CopG family antitoxin
MSALTTRKSIKVSKETYDILARKGTVADSFDDVIKRLLRKEEAAVK